MASTTRWRVAPTRLMGVGRAATALGRGALSVIGGGGSGWLANRPSGWTLLSELDYSQAVPAGGGSERALASPDSAWSVIYDSDGAGGSNYTATTDATGPQSPSSIWRIREIAGTYGDGHAYGSLGRAVPNTSGLYACIAVKWSAGFWTHPISHKWLRSELGGGGNVLIQFAHYGDYFRASDETIGQAYEPQDGSAPSYGDWHIVEVYLVRGNPGTIRVWCDGNLRVAYTNLPLATTGAFVTFSLDEYLGGGGYTLAADQYVYYDHVALYVP